jgi:hypothetical protein
MAEREWQYCLIGGLAVQCRGEPRTTLDTDIALLAGWGKEAAFIDPLLKRFPSRVEAARNFALDRRVLLLRASNAVDIDIILSALPFEAEMIARAEAVEFAPGCTLPCCTAEDLFIMKAFAGRPRDWADAESITVRQAGLDKGYILHHLTALCELKEAPDIPERAKEMLEKTA